MNKKITFSLIAGILLLIIAGIFWWQAKEKDIPQPEQPAASKPKKRLSAPENVLPLSERPQVSLQPFSEAGGRFVSIQVERIPQQSSGAEYEIVYDVDDVAAVSASGAKIKVPESEREGGQQAFMGELDLSSLPTKTKNRFGTCSAGGACINHLVKQGQLLINFASNTPYAVSSAWFYFQTGQQILSIEPLGLTLESKTFQNSQDYLLMQAMGLPAGLSGEVVMLPDTISKDGGSRPLAWQLKFTTSPENGVMTVTLPKEYAGSKLMFYDGKSWQQVIDLSQTPLSDGYFYAVLAN